MRKSRKDLKLGQLVWFAAQGYTRVSIGTVVEIIDLKTDQIRVLTSAGSLINYFSGDLFDSEIECKNYCAAQLSQALNQVNRNRYYEWDIENK